jgi:glycosyltransferase involved in cell wall biosynthesis
LAKGIKRLINNPVEAKEMGRRCRKLIEEKFTLHKIAYDLTRCYELSIGRKRRDYNG